MADGQFENEVIDLIVEICGEDEVRDNRDIDLFDEEIFDSLLAIEFLVEVESRFGVRIAPTELEREEMNTVNKIIARIDERR